MANHTAGIGIQNRSQLTFLEQPPCSQNRYFMLFQISILLKLLQQELIFQQTFHVAVFRGYIQKIQGIYAEIIPLNYSTIGIQKVLFQSSSKFYVAVSTNNKHSALSSTSKTFHHVAVFSA